MQNKFWMIAVLTTFLCGPAIASPIYRVTSEVAQGRSGPGLSVVLAPGQVVGINFSNLGERISSVSAGDRSQFVYIVSGSVVNLRRIKPLNFEGEYNGNPETTLMITTNGSGGQKVYPVLIRFSNRRPAYRVIEISPDGGQSIYPAAQPTSFKVPLTTTQIQPTSSAPAELAILPEEKVKKLPVPRPPSINKSIKVEFPPPESEEFSVSKVLPEFKVEKTFKVEPKLKLIKKQVAQLKVKTARVKTAQIKVKAEKFKPLKVVEKPKQILDGEETQPSLSPSQRALAEMEKYKSNK